MPAGSAFCEKVASTIGPTYSEAMGIEEQAAAEAIAALGLIEPGAMPTILELLRGGAGEHPKATCARYRQQGEQVGDAEKRGLGVRSNGFLSRSALAEITAKGRSDPLRAHELTLLRATFTMLRDRSMLYARQASVQVGGACVVIVHETLSANCSACRALDGRRTSIGEAAVLPPAECEAPCTANYGLRVSVDWLADLD